MTSSMTSFNPERMTPHVWRIPIPTRTLPPASATNTYVIVDGGCAAVVDLGSADAQIRSALCEWLMAMGVQRIQAVIATHYHADHVDGLAPLAHTDLAREAPPLYIHRLDGVRLPAHVAWTEAPRQMAVGTLAVHLWHAPGHTHGHLHVWVESDQLVLVGDNLSGDGTVWVGPPDGHMEAYFHTLEHLKTLRDVQAGPGHGDPLPNVAQAAAALRQRRAMREEQILQLLHQRPLTVRDISRALYAGQLAAGAEFVAQRTVQAHLLRLLDVGAVRRSWDPVQHSFTYTVS
ncbi:MAG: MBL fold metallo-hydrolase [Thermoflavifilum sp.]|nr:MBL fold metallo-hydrolase [Thermoflavifilum sp.]MCL6514613.1 MBL fold metallo-hydrolase [Alicyclobacillus sp.]